MKNNSIYLHQYPGCYELNSLSPFCLKIEYFLKYYKIPYNIITELNPAKGPKNKMPFIQDGKHIVSDSALIIDYLKLNYNLNIDDFLNEEQKLEQFVYLKLLEETFYFILLYSRWIDPNGLKITKEDFKKFFPFPLKNIAIKYIRYSLKKQAYAQGISRYPQDYIYQQGIKIIEIFEKKLNHQKFFFGNTVSTLDFSLFSFLITLRNSPIQTAIYQRLSESNILLSYLKTIEKILAN